MRKIIAFEHVTLDGLIGGPHGEIDWAIRDDELTEYTQQGDERIDMFMFGRVTYDMMVSFWPTEVAKSTNPVFANALNNAPKIVFSRTMERADWEHTTVLKDLKADDILRIKQEPGGNIMIFGSGSLVTQLTNLGLIDEYQLMVNPVLLGKGKPLFNNIQGRMNLKLLNTRTFRSGIVLLQYQRG